MSIASLILGLLSMAWSLVPLIGIIAFVPATIGIILGIIDIVKRKKSKQPLVLAIIGIVSSVLAIFIIIFWIVLIGSSNYNSVANTIINNSILGNESSLNKTESNPILGKWLAESSGGGYFEFDESNTFYWYKSRDDLNDNYYTGKYTVTKGAQQYNGSINYGESGREIYTINLTYYSQKVNGVKETRSDKGMFVIQKNGISQFVVRNMVTDSIYKINRVY